MSNISSNIKSYFNRYFIVTVKECLLLEETHKLRAKNKKIALQRIHKLFQLARDIIREDEELAQYYIAVARRVSMGSRTRIPQEYRRQICKGCKKFILPGVNCRVRVQQRRDSHVVITCGYCGKHMRFPISGEK